MKGFLREFHPIVSVLLFGNVFINLFKSMSYPYFAIYLAGRTELDIKVIGLVIGIGAFTGIIGSFWGGYVSDVIGRRKMMLLSLLISGVVYMGYTWIKSEYLIVIFIIIGGFFISLFEPVSKALISDMTPPDKRLRAFSYRYTGTNIGYAVGPLLGSFMGITGNAMPFLLMAIAYFIYLLILQVLLKIFGIQKIEEESIEQIHLKQVWKAIRSDFALQYFIAGGILSTIVYGLWSVPLSIYLTNQVEQGEKLFSILLSVNAATVIFLQPLLARKMEKISPFLLIMAGSALFALGEIGFGMTAMWWVFIFSMLIFSIGEILVIPSEYMLIDQITPNGMRGSYYGAQSFIGLGLVIGPWLSNLILDLFGAKTMFLIMAFIAISSILFYWRGMHHSKMNLRNHPLQKAKATR
ncbi:MDR family MFS transporter [Paenactinomyces guangxiensis]|uniref:MFS transporter n=1 Tax=Paenactinomyces guangxiensis TaxID=1490290 RepID=A0A7W1WPN9_9BACL|nr:MFS transporter [Paenactinomyces guangxiensis]MBA4493793.1 MFS transporter [Paenactinomyces guangxiensis]MBH8591259.1 MFS transporter [Paenactinomyces guangxiensis]